MTNIGSRGENLFVPRERGSLPRILLLDFDDSYKEFLESENYSVYAGRSGFAQTPFHIPIHESEVEMIFWDTSNLNADGKFCVESKIYDYSSGTAHIRSSITDTLAKYCSRIEEKGGFVVFFLGDAIPALNLLTSILQHKIIFKRRNTTTLNLSKHEKDDVWYEFYSRFIKEENIKFSIEINDSFVPYFEDEDSNVFAVSYRSFAIIPRIEEKRKRDALIFLLQEVLPSFCEGEDIFPDKYYYRWANGDLYLPSEVQKLRKREAEIRKQYEEQTKKKKHRKG